MRIILLSIIFSSLSAGFCYGDPCASLLSGARNNDPKQIEEHFKPCLWSVAYLDLWTALHESAYHNSVQAAEKLLELGADIQARDGNGFTPLYVAQHKRHSEMIHFLLKNMAL